MSGDVQILRIDASVKYSTSAIDAAGCFHQVRELNKNLKCFRRLCA